MWGALLAHPDQVAVQARQHPLRGPGDGGRRGEEAALRAEHRTLDHVSVVEQPADHPVDGRQLGLGGSGFPADVVALVRQLTDRAPVPGPNDGLEDEPP
jgi:hypothetical protein